MKFYAAPDDGGQTEAVAPFLKHGSDPSGADVEARLFKALEKFAPLSKLVNITMGNAQPIACLGSSPRAPELVIAGSDLVATSGVRLAGRRRALETLRPTTSQAAPTNASFESVDRCLNQNLIPGFGDVYSYQDAAGWRRIYSGHGQSNLLREGFEHLHSRNLLAGRDRLLRALAA